jgi:undecaprenyl-diphosphatase
MISYAQAIILGLLQGITELFPISSLGHSIILPAILGWQINQNAAYFLAFLVATHFATCAVLFCFYWEDWVRIISGILRSIKTRRAAADLSAKLGWLLIIGTVPAGIAGIVIQKQVQALFISPRCVAGLLALNGILLWVAEFLRKRAARTRYSVLDADDRIATGLTGWQAAKVGMMQLLALLPGFSRTGSALAGGLMAGLTHEDALRFSFLLATPIIGAAALLKLPTLFISANARLIGTALLGAISAAVAAYFSVKFLTKYFQTRTLRPFAIYCLLIGILSMLILSRR